MEFVAVLMATNSTAQQSRNQSKITFHCALWSAAACCRFCCGWKCSIALKAQASLRASKLAHSKEEPQNLVWKTRIHSVVRRISRKRALPFGCHWFETQFFTVSAAALFDSTFYLHPSVRQLILGASLIVDPNTPPPEWTPTLQADRDRPESLERCCSRQGR